MPAGEIEGHAADERVWRRAARDTANAATTVRFALAVLAATVASGLIGGLLSGAIAFVAVLTMLFVWKLLRAPIHQRDEARRELHPNFPRHRFELEPPWYGDQLGPPPVRRVLFVPLRFINRDVDRMILEFELIEQRRMSDNQWSQGTHVAHYDRLATADAILPRATAEPKSSLNGVLAFDGNNTLALEYLERDEEAAAGDVAVKDYWRVLLRVTDLVSGATIERTLPPPLLLPERSEPSS